MWFYVAKESGSFDVVNRLIDTITDRFHLLAGFPYLGRSRNEEFGNGRRSFAVGEYVIIYAAESAEAVNLTFPATC